MKCARWCLGLLFVLTGLLAAEKPAEIPPPPVTPPGWRYEELRRFKAPEARQAVVADRDFLYVISNHALGRYRKATGERVAAWEGGENGEVIHLNAGLFFEGRLYCVHSNFPGVPMLSSVEIFDPVTLKHVGSHSFGRMDGSFTWLDRAPAKMAGTTAARWIACFVHYGERGAEPGRDGAWTQIVAMDDAWRRTAAWALPPALIERFGGRGYSASGGAFGPGGYLYITGHDNAELYVLEFPAAGSVMRWIATVPIPAEGQAFGWDPDEPEVLYTILKRTREVIVGRVTRPKS